MSLNTAVNLLLSLLRSVERGMEVESESPMFPGFFPNFDSAFQEVADQLKSEGYDPHGVVCGLRRRVSGRFIHFRLPQVEAFERAISGEEVAA